MGVFENFPYSNYHDLNLDWILKEIEKTVESQNKLVEDMTSFADEIRGDMVDFTREVNRRLAEMQAILDAFPITIRPTMESILNEWGVEPLPVVDSADNGKVLAVVGGSWNKAAIPSGNLPPVSSADNGKALSVINGSWGLGGNITSMADSIETLNDHFDETPPTNLFDPSTLETGVCCTSTSLRRTVDSRYNLITIPVTPGATYLMVRASDTATQGTQTGWSAVVFCNANMQGTEVIRVSTDGNYGAFTVPSGNYYAVISYYASNTTPVIVEHPAPTAWSTRFDPAAAETDPTYAVDPSVTIHPDTLGTAGNNIIDESSMISGKCDGGLWSSGGTFVCTKLLPIEPDTTYYSLTDLRYICYYNNNKEYINQLSVAGGVREFTTAGNIKFVRITAFASDSGTLMVSKNPIEHYEAYKKVFVANSPMLNDQQKNDVDNSLFIDNVLRGKKWVVCGDSFSSYGGVGTSKLTDGLYKGHYCVYPYIIGNRTGVNVVSFAAGGRTLGYSGNTNSLTNPSASYYYQNIPADADYITIYLGINDDDYDIPLGTINDNTSATHLGAFNEVISWLLEHRPYAHIGIIVTNATDNNDWPTGQIAIANKYGIPYINMNGDDRTPAVFRSTNPNIPSAIKNTVNSIRAVDWDGSQSGTANKHPNDNTQKLQSTFIEAFLKSI